MDGRQVSSSQVVSGIGGQVGGRQVGSWQMQRNRKTGRQQTGQRSSVNIGRQVGGRQLGDTKE